MECPGRDEVSRSARPGSIPLARAAGSADTVGGCRADPLGPESVLSGWREGFLKLNLHWGRTYRRLSSGDGLGTRSPSLEELTRYELRHLAGAPQWHGCWWPCWCYWQCWWWQRVFEEVGGEEVSLCVRRAEGRGPLSHDCHQGWEKQG